MLKIARTAFKIVIALMVAITLVELYHDNAPKRPDSTVHTETGNPFDTALNDQDIVRDTYRIAYAECAATMSANASWVHSINKKFWRKADGVLLRGRFMNDHTGDWETDIPVTCTYEYDTLVRVERAGMTVFEAEPNQAQIRMVQTFLKASGYYDGDLTGKDSPGLLAALQQWRLDSSGAVNYHAYPTIKEMIIITVVTFMGHNTVSQTEGN